MTSSLFGFIELGDFVWDNHTTIVVDPAQFTPHLVKRD
ncbi:DUF1820 family protein [Vibrio tritonius]